MVVVVVATAGTRGMKGTREGDRKGGRERERERARCERGMRVALLLVYVHYVRYACASVDQVVEGARAGRVVERLGGLGGWPMAVAPERGGSSCCAEGVVPTVAEGVGARGEGGRRLPRRVVNLSAALRRRRGRYYFLLFSPLLLLLLLLILLRVLACLCTL